MITQEKLKSFLHYDDVTGIFTWLVNKGNKRAGEVAGCVKRLGYIRVVVDGRSYSAHRLAWLYVYGVMPSEFIDHINGNPSDNKIANLREASPYQNSQNMREPYSSSLTGVMGVTLHKQTNKYQAQIKNQGKQIYIGLFSTKEEAHEAYLLTKRKIHTFCTI